MSVNGPRVSVITTVYNGERFLAEAIESILQQSYGDFEYILINDASTDSSPTILDHYASLDPRLLVFHNSSNLHIDRSLNRALGSAHGDYIAVLDQDDLAHSQRLERQVAFLDANPEIGVVGTQAVSINAGGQSRRSMVFPIVPDLARWVILFATPVLHSAAMMRRSLLQKVGGYGSRSRYAADYALWAELITHTKIANLPETLVSYRRHDHQTSTVAMTPQQGEVWLLIFRMLVERLSLRVPLDDIGVLYHGVRGSQLEDAAALARASDLLAAIRERYLAVEQPAPATVEEINGDCAQRLLTMAWVHRHSQRADSRMLLQRALEFDPQLWQRARTRAQLRRLSSRKAY